MKDLDFEVIADFFLNARWIAFLLQKVKKKLVFKCFWATDKAIMATYE